MIITSVLYLAMIKKKTGYIDLPYKTLIINENAKTVDNTFGAFNHHNSFSDTTDRESKAENDFP